LFEILAWVSALSFFRMYNFGLKLELTKQTVTRTVLGEHFGNGRLKRFSDLLAKLSDLDRVLALSGIIGRELENVRGRVAAPHGEGTEIMKAGDFDFTRLDRLENTWQEADADAMAQLRVLKTHAADFPQHGETIGMPMGVPAGRERIHMKKPSAVSE
jgi:hypothetical protein